jgi:xylulokinase
MSDFLVGIDVGTTGAKALVVDLNGNLLGSGYREYPCQYPKPNWVEQDAELVIQKTFEACREALSDSGVDAHRIISVGFSTQRATFCILDGDMSVIGGNFYVWQDNRALSEMEYIESVMPARELYQIVGMPITPTFSFSKVIWLMRNDPERYGKARYISLMPDYVLYRFGSDEFCCEVTNACCSSLIDVHELRWSDTIIDSYGIDRTKLPPLVKPGTLVGKITADVAARTGLVEGTPISTGTGDQQCAAIGAGVVEPGYAELTLGTSGVLVVATKKPVLPESGIMMVPASGAWGLYDVEGIQLGAASSYRWFRDELCGLEKCWGDEIGENPYTLMEQHVRNSPVGARGVVFLPFMSGSGCPHWDVHAKGVFAGLTFSHSKSDLVRAVMEGITLEAKDIYRAMQDIGVEITRLATTGGAANSPTWQQIMADMFNVEIHKLKVSEATTLGAAILGGVGAGVFKDAADGVSHIVHYEEAVTPNGAHVERYERLYETYTNIHHAFTEHGSYKMLSDLQET